MPMPTALDLLLQDAKESLTANCHAVPIWNIPGFYQDTAGHTAAKRLMEADAQVAYLTALAYRYTGDPAYADKSKELLQGWATVNREITDNDGPLVSAYLGAGLIQAANLIQSYPGWTREDREQFTDWMTRVCLPMWDRIPLRNNWWNWSLYAQLALYRFMDDTAHFAEETANLKDHIDASLSLDGFIPEEATRGTNAIWYHYFALAPATAAAKLIRDTTGEDLFHWTSPGGKSIKKALDTLFYYADGHAEDWPYDQDQRFPAPLTPRTWPLDLFDAMAKVYRDSEYERFAAAHRPIVGNKNVNTGFFHSHAWIYPELQFEK